MLTVTGNGQSPFETGRMAPGDGRLFRPGGLDLTRRAIELARLCAGARVLDLGCGAGESVLYLRQMGIEAFGVDYASCPAASGLAEDARIAASAEVLPIADRTVDGVLAECSLSLMGNRERALAECARVLVDGGRLMISDLYARQPEDVAGVRALKGFCGWGILVREELTTNLSDAGFNVDVWEDQSRALRECAARYIFEHGSLDGMWGCRAGESSRQIHDAMRTARAGYFLLIATRNKR